MAEKIREKVLNKKGEVIDMGNSFEFAKLIFEMVPNPVARSVLFGTPVNVTNVDILAEAAVEDKLGGESGLTQVMRSTITLAFVVAITRWKQLYDNAPWDHAETTDAFRNSRFTKIFLSALSKEDITLDLQIFALIELWVSLKKSDEYIREEFANIYSMGRKGENFGLTLQEIRDVIKKSSFNNLNSNYDLEYANYLCYKLINSFPFLRTIEIDYPTVASDKNKHSLCIRYPLNTMGDYAVLYPNDFYDRDNFVVTDQQLFFESAHGEQGDDDLDIPQVVSLFMLSEASAFTGKLQYTYRSFDGDKEARIETPEHQSEDFLQENAEEIHEMRKFLSFNYKNIREFAIIISDALKDSPVNKKEIFDLCRQKYPKIIPTDIQSVDSVDLYWDNIITLMLVELGPSDFLEIILDEDNVFNTIIQNIEWRYAGYHSIATLRAEYNEAFAYLSKRCESNERTFLPQLLNLRVRTVLGAMGFDKEENKGIHPFEESLTFKFENINNCIETLRQYYDNPSGGLDIVKCDMARATLNDIYKNIFIFLQVFYTALDSYSVFQQNLEKEKPRMDLNEDDLRKKQENDHRELIKKFSETAANKYAEIYKQTTTQAFEAFCSLCKEYNTFDSSKEFNISEKAKNLKYLITRNYICDEKKLRYFVEITLSDGTQSTIFEMLENFSYKYYSDIQYAEWLTYFQDVFLFLIYNEDYNKRGLYNENKMLEDKDCDPIYPYLVTYYKENTDRDNLKKCAYRVPIPTKKDTDPKEQGYVVTLLTEREFPGTTYFCIPLRYGSSDRWWINPFLISRRFLRRMDAILQEKGIKFK